MSAEVVRAALDEVIRFVVCPQLISELRDVLARKRFRRYFTIDEANVYTDAIEATAELVSDPEDILEVSLDPDDDYLIALARREGVDAIISGDSDLQVEGGPPTLSPGDVLRAFRLDAAQQTALLIALWNLHLRIEQAATETRDPQLATLLETVHSAARTLGGDPHARVFGLEDLSPEPVDIRDLDRTERTACAYALKLDRQASGALHAEHVGDAERLPLAFEVLDRYAAVEHLLE